MELDLFACEKLEKCNWQCFALHRGIGRGLIKHSLEAWREAHERHCGGKLVQLKASAVSATVSQTSTGE